MSRLRTSPRALAALLARRRRRGDVEAAARRVFTARLAPAADARDFKRLWFAWRSTLRLLRPLGSVSEGNRVRLYSEGDEAFDAMWGAIVAARESVLLSTYIFEPDKVGLRTLEILTEAARRGCAVTLAFDAFGSFRLEAALLAPLRAAGGQVIAYNPMWGWSGLASRSRLARNHQKILVVDERLAFCGGMNVADEYAGPRHGNALFRDTLLGVEGPCAVDLARRIAAIVAESAGRVPQFSAPGLGPGSTLVQILESNVWRERRAIQKALRTTISHAVERVWLTSPYFVPPRKLVRTLARAAKRGVDVRVLTAGRTDVPIVRRASHHLYGRLLEGGVRIFEMQKRTLHAKTAAIDGVYASVGSFNLDHWSDRRNLEVNVSVLDRELVRSLERDFENDLALSEEVRLESWRRRGLLERIVDGISYQILRI
jgi:cardiolipin synthase